MAEALAAISFAPSRTLQWCNQVDTARMGEQSISTRYCANFDLNAPTEMSCYGPWFDTTVDPNWICGINALESWNRRKRETHDGNKRTNGRRERLGPNRLDGRMEDTLRWLRAADGRESLSLDMGLQFRLYRRAELGEPRFHPSLPYAVLG